MSRVAARAGAFAPKPSAAAAREDTAVKAIFGALSSTAAIESASTHAEAVAAARGMATSLPTTMLARHLDSPLIAGLGGRILSTFKRDLTYSAFRNALDSLCGGEPHELLAQLFNTLADEADRGATASAVASVLQRAYTLDTGRRTAKLEAFRQAATSASIAMGASVHSDTASSGELFGAWAASALPGLARVLVTYIERLC